MIYFKITFIISILFLIQSCNHLFYHPNTRIYTDPKIFNLNYNEINILTEDKVNLNGWIIYANTKKPIASILHFHGNSQNITSHFLYSSWLSNYGFDIIIFDYRGFGKSSGKPTRDGLIKDGIAALNWTKKNSRTAENFILGQSLGGAVAIPAYVQNSVPSIKAIILDSTFSSYRRIARQKAGDFFITWLFQWPLSFLVSDDWSPIDSISQIQIPIISIHSLNDPIVPFDLGKELYSQINSKKDFWEIPQEGHCSALIQKDSTYRKKLINFLCNQLPKKEEICNIN
ncbi:MAG: alpha/beta hydrolase [Spirobacillus cienkowskii]|jgi:fermentation-respiration switch protein FrsA (DUF1100 family)|uniref:Alpha/beta hydrolase n=1 Tax=Spirobacillus cienkowskii TaxID=495820 RepID=A0A369KVR0_9BACT|nr:MAG: alpha/beta hydrolase [Spirobacillus cienkowskii]